MTRFATILADPPWPHDVWFSYRKGKPKNDKRVHYTLSSMETITAFLPISEVADDAILFMWRISGMVPQAYDLCRDWGFEPVGEIVWHKTYKHKTDTTFFGMGMTLHLGHENVIVGIRGKPNLQGTWPNIIKAPNFRHSQKPDDLHRIAERIHHGPYLECFGRRPMPGWEVRGNEPGVHNLIDGKWIDTAALAVPAEGTTTAGPMTQDALGAVTPSTHLPADVGQRDRHHSCNGLMALGGFHG